MRKFPAIGSKVGLWLVLVLCIKSGWAGIWVDETLSAKGVELPFAARLLVADRAALHQALAAAPLEGTTSQGAQLELPLPDGSLQRFEVENSPVMAPELAARYPEIATYKVVGLDDPAITGRLDLTPAGFHAMLTTPRGTVLIDPDGSGGYRSYFARDYRLAAKGLGEDAASPSTCLVGDAQKDVAQPFTDYALRTSGSRRIYRLAVAATGEYTQFQHQRLQLDDPVTSALSAIVTAINRVNEIYGRDLALQFVLVANNAAIIYTNAETDPYTNDDGFAMLSENQTNLDSRIGAANYDVGHVFSTGGGGIAAVGVGCLAGAKAKGVTGRPDPEGDIFYIDLVAHELGHQLDAVHSFNGTTDNCIPPNRIGESAVEPGSGSTIMSYAGLCGLENIQSHSDAVFHAKSMQEIVAYTSTGVGATCGDEELTNNTAPSVFAGSDYSIPAATPFILQGEATDPEGDTLSYQWDQMDAGGEIEEGYATDEYTLGTDLRGNPLFRSFMPVSTPRRVLPRLSDLVAGISDKAEVLPTTSRTLNFRLTARDGQSGVGEDDMQVNVIETAGPFVITRVSSTIIDPTVPIILEWAVAGTDSFPINCASVDIHLLAFNSDKSAYCEHSIKSAVPNTGNYYLNTMPAGLGTDSGRIRVKCSDNLFFDINDSDLTILDPVQSGTDCLSTDGTPLLQGTVFNDAGEALSPTPPPDGDGGGGGGLSWWTLLLGLAWAARSLLGTRGSSSART
jgi:hypothetical protein